MLDSTARYAARMKNGSYKALTFSLKGRFCNFRREIGHKYGLPRTKLDVIRNEKLKKFPLP
jgi:hypothetical protein